MTRFAPSFTARVSRVAMPAALIAAATLTQAFGQTSKITQTEVRLEPSGAEAVHHDQFGTVVAASANGNTLAVHGITTDDGPISEVGAIFIWKRATRRCQDLPEKDIDQSR